MEEKEITMTFVSQPDPTPAAGPAASPDAAPEATPAAVPSAASGATHTSFDARTPVVDVLIVGGGAAGLSAGLVLGRARRSVLIVDGGQPRNAPAEGVHGYLTRDGIPPAELVARGRAEVEHYGGVIRDGQVVDTRRDPDGLFVATLDDGSEVLGRRLLIATGLVDVLPDIPGLAPLWGKDVLHCPYCHGWEVRDRRIGVLATSPMSFHQAWMFRQWTDDLTFFLADVFEPSDEQWEQLAARGIRVVRGPVAEVALDEDGRISGVTLADGTAFSLDALAVGSRVEARIAPFAPLGVVASDHPMGVGTHVAVDETGATGIPGVWAIGNVSELRAQVSTAVAAGTFTAAQINADLIIEDTAAAVAAYRARAEAPAADAAPSRVSA
jgi:thioredoxin reductase